MSIINKAPQAAKAVAQNLPNVTQKVAPKATSVAAKSTPAIAPKPHAVGKKLDRQG